MINNVIPIRIAEENRCTCLNYLVLKSLESSAFKIQTIKTKDRLREVNVHSEIKLMSGQSSN